MRTTFEVHLCREYFEPRGCNPKMNMCRAHPEYKQPQKVITLLEETQSGEIKLYGKDSEDIARTYWNLAHAQYE